MEIKKDYSLLNYNSFRADEKAKFFVQPENEKQLVCFLEQRDRRYTIMVVGNGCNMLFTKPFEHYIVHPKIKGIKVLKEDDEQVKVSVSAGEDWEKFVDYCVKKGWGGVENLTKIPGSVGAAPVQNIGAYGTEISEVIHKVRGYFVESVMPFAFGNRECCFEYRDSIFKSIFSGKIVITSVEFILKKNSPPNTSYQSVKQALEKENISAPTLADVARIIKNIREEKLPDIKKLPSAGSFFKNPTVSEDQSEALKKTFPDLPTYPAENGVKLAAGWMIEQCEWKGVRHGDVGVHANQALVIVNYKNATGAEILAFSQKINSSVKAKFGITLEPEVNIL